MKKLIALLMTIIMATGLLIGCGQTNTPAISETPSATQQDSAPSSSGSDSEAKEVNLVYWGALPPENGPQKVIDNYKAVAPNVNIEYVRYVNDDAGNMKLDTALMAGEKIDFFTSYGVDRRDKRVNAKMADDITDLCQKYDIDLIRDFGPAAQPNIKDGRVYSIPTATLIGFIAVNKDAFEKAGIPLPTEWTMDEFKEICKKLTSGEGNNKVYGIIGDYNVNPVNFLKAKLDTYPQFNQDMNGTTWLDIPDFKKGFQQFFEMMYVDKSMMSWEDVLMQKLTNSEALAAAFFSGRSSMMVTGSYMLRTIKDSEKYPRDFKVAFLRMPSVDKNQDKYYKDETPSDDMMINPTSENKDEAVKFIKWYATEGFDPMIEGGRIPLYKNYDKQKVTSLLLKGVEELCDTQSFTENVLFQSEYIVSVRNVPNAAELEAIYREEQEAFYLDHKNVDKLLENLKKRQDGVMSGN